jgi:hypothetical protein
VVIETSLDELRANINHASLTINDVKKIDLRGNYTHIRASHITEAIIDISNGELQAKEITKATITSNGCSIGLLLAPDLTINSTDDQYDIDEAGKLSGSKNFGDLRIIRLKNSMDLAGNTADIKLRNILPSVSLIKIDNKYASMELPVTGLTNYNVVFEGKYTKVVAPFTKQETPKASISVVDGPPADASFKASVGTGLTTAFKLNCSNCTVDFK